MAKKKTRATSADPEGAPLQAYLAALRHRSPDPAYTAFTKRLGPERTVECNDASAKLLRGRLTRMARRIAFHEERQQMLAIHEQTRVRMGLPPESTAWIDAHLQERYPAYDDAVAEQHLARLADRIDRLPLEAEAAYGHVMRGGRPRRHPVRDEIRAVLRTPGAPSSARAVWDAFRKRKGMGVIIWVHTSQLCYVDDSKECVLGYAAFQKLVSEEKTRLRRAR